MIQTLRKPKYIALAILVAAFACVPIGCNTVTDSSGKTSQVLKPEAKAVLQASGDVLAQALAQAAVIETTGAVNQYASTGKVDQKQLSSAIVSGIAANAQGYIGQVMTAYQLAKVTGVPAVAQVAPDKATVTQQTVDTLNAVAAVQSVPK